MTTNHLLECYPWLPKVTEEFGLRLLDVRLLSGGNINQIFQIQSTTGTYVLRRYPSSRRLRQIEFEVLLHDKLVDSGFPVPRILADNAGKRVFAVADAHYLWMEFLDACPLSQKEAYGLSLDSIVEFWAPLQEALEKVEVPFRGVHETRVFARRLPPLISQLQLAGRDKDATLIENELLRLTDWERSHPLPFTAIHADVHPGNVLRARQSDQLYLIDFDDAHVGHRAIDWILPALEFSLDEKGDLDQQRYRLLLNKLSRRASDAEVQAFGPLLHLMLLKFSASLADLGRPLDQNTYLPLLFRCLEQN